MTGRLQTALTFNKRLCLDMKKRSLSSVAHQGSANSGDV